MISTKKYLIKSISSPTNTVYTRPTSSGNNTTYGTGTSSASGLTKLYTEEGDNEDGALTQKFLKHMLQTRVQGFTPENHNYMVGYQLLGSNHTKPLPWIRIDNSIFYLMPNNLALSSACRILDINGVVYTKYLNFNQ